MNCLPLPLLLYKLDELSCHHHLPVRVQFPELAGGGMAGAGSGGSEGRGAASGMHRPAHSPRSNGGGAIMSPGMGATPMPTSPAAAAAAAAAMHGYAYGGQMGGSHQEMMVGYGGYGQGMMPYAQGMAPMPGDHCIPSCSALHPIQLPALAAHGCASASSPPHRCPPHPGMMYQGSGGGMPYGMVSMQPYGYMPMRPGQQEAMMQAYAAAAAGMQMGYSPYGGPGGGGMPMPMPMPMSPGGGMQVRLNVEGGVGGGAFCAGQALPLCQPQAVVCGRLVRVTKACIEGGREGGSAAVAEKLRVMKVRSPLAALDHCFG